MTDAAKKEDEPSIEEILDSIKQIISDEEEDDEEIDLADAAARLPDREMQKIQPTVENTNDDVLILTETVGIAPVVDDILSEEETPGAVSAMKEEAFESRGQEEQVTIEIDLLDTHSKSDTIEVQLETLAETSTSNVERILTNKAQQATIEGFSDLVRKSSLERGGITLEDIVRSELNPMLREWLDKYLPDIIERLVKEELHEITKRILN